MMVDDRKWKLELEDRSLKFESNIYYLTSRSNLYNQPSIIKILIIMNIKEQIEKEYLEAYKAHNDEFVAVLRILKSELKNAEIAKKSELVNEEVISVIKRQIKQRLDTIEIYKKSGKEEAASSEQKEIDILSKYLPAQLSEEETKNIVVFAIEKLGASDSSQTGRVIGEVMKDHKDDADGALVAKIARELLQK